MAETKKRLLILKASQDVTRKELKHIKAVADILDIKCCETNLTTADTLKDCLCCGKGQKWNYVYVAAHSDIKGFGEESGDPFIQWEDLADALCETECLADQSVLLLACCQGGLRRIAATLFERCTKIDYICGPRWSLTPADLAAAFHIFLYNLEYRNEEPSVAVDRASAAVNYRFSFHDRIEWDDFG